MEAFLGLDRERIKILLKNKIFGQFEFIIRDNNAVNTINAIASINREKVILFFNSKYKKLKKLRNLNLALKYS